MIIWARFFLRESMLFQKSERLQLPIENRLSATCKLVTSWRNKREYKKINYWAESKYRSYDFLDVNKRIYQILKPIKLCTIKVLLLLLLYIINSRDLSLSYCNLFTSLFLRQLCICECVRRPRECIKTHSLGFLPKRQELFKKRLLMTRFPAD